MSTPATSLPPGFRFHPTDEELILHYLRNRAASTPCPVSIIAEVDIYKYDPWHLPAKAMFGDREWYFFTPRDRKYPNGVRPNRTAASGYWKATGTDKPILTSTGGGNMNVGVKKALVFYRGRPPKGLKTNWIMHEYRLAEAHSSNSYKPMKLRDSSMRLDDWVLCRIYKKSNNLQSVDPPLMDGKQEDSGTEDGYVSIGQNITPQENSSPKLQKSFSVSEFLDDDLALSHLFDSLPETPGPENGSHMGNPSAQQPVINSSGINYVVQQLSQAGHPAFIAESYLKRQQMDEEESTGLLHPSKKRNDSCNFTNFANQFDTPQYSMMSQTLFNQQLLLNSHLGLH